jgi:hypothetical protein
MSNRRLIVLAIIAGLMVVWAVFQSNISNKPKTRPGSPVYLVQGLDPADIDSIVLGKADNTVTLKRQGGRFVVANKDNYPAVTAKVNELITKCLDIKTGELYTADKANHKALGVTEEDAEIVVKFFRPDSSLLTGVVMGKSKEQGQGSYVRLLSNDSVYVTMEQPWFSNSAMNYIEQELFSINRDDIESVTVNGPDEVYTLRVGDSSDDIILENLPEGKKLKNSDAKNVLFVLASLRFDDVKNESTVEDKFSFNRQFICRLKDSTVYTIKIAERDDKTYITCSAEFTDKILVTEKEVKDSNDTELKEKEARFLARDKANEFSAKNKGWIYEIPEYKAKNLTKPLFELVEDEPKLEETTQTSDPNSTETNQ